MQNTPDNSFNGWWYGSSFLLLLVAVVVVFYLLAGQSRLPRWSVDTAWATSGAGGILCALIGGGGLNRKPIDGMGSLLLILHIMSLGLLMAIRLAPGP